MSVLVLLIIISYIYSMKLGFYLVFPGRSRGSAERSSPPRSLSRAFREERARQLFTKGLARDCSHRRCLRQLFCTKGFVSFEPPGFPPEKLFTAKLFTEFGLSFFSKGNLGAATEM